MDNIDSLNLLHFDILKEISSIGAGNAATSLSKMLNVKVQMSVPFVRMLEFNKISDLINGSENIVIATLAKVTGQVQGIMMYLMEEIPACHLMERILHKEFHTFSDFHEMEISAFCEIGNILISPYLGSISSLTGLRITPSVPSLSIDMAGAILSVPAIEFGKISDKVLIIESSFEGDEALPVIFCWFLICARFKRFLNHLE